MTLFTLFTTIGAFIYKAFTIIIMLGLIVFLIAINVQFIKENTNNRQ